MCNVCMCVRVSVYACACACVCDRVRSSARNTITLSHEIPEHTKIGHFWPLLGQSRSRTLFVQLVPHAHCHVNSMIFLITNDGQHGIAAHTYKRQTQTQTQTHKNHTKNKLHKSFRKKEGSVVPITNLCRQRGEGCIVLNPTHILCDRCHLR